MTLILPQIGGWYSGAGGGELSYAHVANSTSKDSQVIAIPAAAQVGDIAVLFDVTATGPAVYPSGWTGIYQQNASFEVSVSYKLLQSGDAGSDITGQTNTLYSVKNMHVFRPSTSVSAVTLSSVNASGETSGAPAQQAMNVAAAPAIVFGMIRAYPNEPFIDETFWDAEVYNFESNGSKMKSYYEIQNDGATDRTITASGDYGNFNFTMGFVINAS